MSFVGCFAAGLGGFVLCVCQFLVWVVVLVVRLVLLLCGLGLVLLLAGYGCMFVFYGIWVLRVGLLVLYCLRTNCVYGCLFGVMIARVCWWVVGLCFVVGWVLILDAECWF